MGYYVLKQKVLSRQSQVVGKTRNSREFRRANLCEKYRRTSTTDFPATQPGEPGHTTGGQGAP